VKKRDVKAGNPMREIRYHFRSISFPHHVDPFQDLISVTLFQRPHTPRVRPQLSFPPENTTAGSVAQTVWLLWGKDQDSVWGIFERWAKDAPMKGAARAILEIGLSRGYISRRNALKRCQGWLARTISQREVVCEAFTVLVEFLSPRQSLSVANGWRERFDEGSWDVIEKTLRALSKDDPFAMLPKLIEWARRDPKDSADTAKLIGEASLGHLNADELKVVLVGLRTLDSEVRSKDSRQVIAKTIKEAADRRSDLVASDVLLSRKKERSTRAPKPRRK
jgi:hypothetical protein